MLNVYQLEELIRAQMKEGHVPGFALAIVQDLQIVYAMGFGVTAVYGEEEGHGLPVTPRTLFRIGSVTKSLTGTAIMRLVEAGKLDLDCPVKKYVPWLTFSKAGAADGVTLRMLLSHTAGLGRVGGCLDFGLREPSGLEAFVRERIPSYPLVAPAGKLWYYSSGVDIAGFVAEVVSGRPYAELMQEFVFGPLDMARSTFDPTVAMTWPLAQSHDLDGNGTLSVQHRFADNTEHYPSGFAMSTVLDMANFAIMQMDHGRFGEEQFLSAESVAEMQRVHADMYTLGGTGYGLTWFSGLYKGVRRVGHGGGISTFKTALDMVPEAGVAVIAMANRGDERFRMAEIVDHILDHLLDLPQEQPGPQSIPPDKSLWPMYTGTYVGDGRGLAIIRETDDGLVLDLNGEVMPLESLRSDLYFTRIPASAGKRGVGFVHEETGPVQYLVIDGWPTQRLPVCVRIASETLPKPDPASWAAYVGQYRVPGDTLTVRIENDSLLVHSKAQNVDDRLIPLGGARFASSSGVWEFVAAGDGTITALKLRNTIMRVEADE